MVQAAVGWQCPDCVSVGRKKTRDVRPMTFNRNRTGVVGSTNPTPVVLALIALNVVVFVASGFGKSSVIDRFGDEPSRIYTNHQYYRLFDAMFLHLNLLHIAGNMIALLIVGPAVEVMLGKVRFVALYLIAGIAGNVAFYLIAPPFVVQNGFEVRNAAAGASGAIFAVMGAYVVLAARRRQPLQQVVALIIVNLIIGFTGNIGWQAHVGGLAVGALLAWLYDQLTRLRPVAKEIGATVLLSVGALALLALMVHGIAPGHINLGS
jgi:membrane associated rhomboid family serine protease